jgi:putative hydrolase of the HAD superfamily
MKTTLLAPRCVLFDAVGTLIFADPPVEDVYHSVGARHGSQLSRAEIRERFREAFRRHTNDDGVASSARERRRWEGVVGDVFCELSDAHGELLDELWRYFSQPSAWQLFDDVVPCIAELRARGYALGVASNFDERLVGVCRGQAALAELKLFWSSDIGYSKPHPQFFAQVAQRLELQPHEILLIGDDKTADYRGAQAASWHAIHIHRHGKASSHDSITTLAAIPPMLASSPAGG